MNIDDFAESFHQEVLSRAGDAESPVFRENAFVEVMIEYLVEANEVDDGEVTYFRHASRREKVNGFAYASDGECLDLFIADYSGTAAPRSVSAADQEKHFMWLTRFLASALGGAHRDLEESSPVFDLAQHIHREREEITRARLFLLTDGVTKSVRSAPQPVNGIEVSHFVWDLERLRRFITSRMRREPIVIDFASDEGGAIPCLEAQHASDEYQTFLAFLPGARLAALYAEHGPRLLEKNVRSFLQARAATNKGIRRTILEEPHRFLAYNNGISATAETVDVGMDGSGTLCLRSARDFQVVNGGQTTASIYHAYKKDKADLSALMVQVKLTVPKDPGAVDLFVPLISKYANSQNKVNTADFSANHPYHIALEEASRRLWAPSPSGSESQTHWYYERARGSYLDDKAREGTPARIRAFEAQSPLRQKFTKTDLAKYENSWDQFPHLVCLGAEKNFLKFTTVRTEGTFPTVDEDYFHRLIAKAILFKAAERLVGAQHFGGYRAQIVAYTIAWLSHHTAQRIDLLEIWRQQQLSPTLGEAIVAVAAYANSHITNPPATRRNPGEWCKREECWEAFRQVEIALPAQLGAELVSVARHPLPPSSTLSAQAGIEPNAAESAQIDLIAKISAETWFRLSKWAKETDNLAPWQRGLAFSLGRLAGSGRKPSFKQAVQGAKIITDATRKGFKAEGE